MRRSNSFFGSQMNCAVFIKQHQTFDILYNPLLCRTGKLLELSENYGYGMEPNGHLGRAIGYDVLDLHEMRTSIVLFH